MTKTFAIVGGGIAGLTTAIALKRIGIRPTIFEAAPEIKAIGAGLGLAANAIKAYQKLGIAEEINALGKFLSNFTIYDQKGKAITAVESGKISQKYGLDNFTIHRADLHQFLLSQIDPDTVYKNKRVIAIEQKGQEVILKFQDGSIYETDFLIGADGIHSPIRQQLLPHLKPRYAGYTCWRAVIDNGNLRLTESAETWGKAGRFGIVPLKDNKIYWFACVNAPQNDKTMKAFQMEDLQNRFKDFHSPIPQVLAETKNENLILNDILDLPPNNHYAFGNIVLIGDAAHATTPNMGQGACQAIEDAVILAQEIENNADPKVAFKQFEQRRLKRTHYIVKNSWTVGKVAQLENKHLIALRNFFFRLLPSSVRESQLKLLYKVDF